MFSEYVFLFSEFIFFFSEKLYQNFGVSFIKDDFHRKSLLVLKILLYLHELIINTNETNTNNCNTF